MPRRARNEVAGGIYHVFNRGNRRQAIVRDDEDRRALMRELDTVVRHYRWTCLAYCFMTNHFHAVVETTDATLGTGMRRLEGRYAQCFNRRHGVSGHVFQGRFTSKLVTTDEYFAQLLRYVALNPVKERLCADPSDWPWSSHHGMLTGIGIPASSRSRVADLLGGPGAYAAMFEPGHPLAERYGDASPWEYRPPLAELLAHADRDAGMRAARDAGYRLDEIAVEVGLSVSTVCRRTNAK